MESRTDKKTIYYYRVIKFVAPKSVIHLRLISACRCFIDDFYEVYLKKSTYQNFLPPYF